MYSYYDIKERLKPEEVLLYLRKSRADDPLLSVEEVLSKHETRLNEWVDRNLSAPIPEENRFKEVVSGESIADRPEFQKVLKLVESPSIKAVLVVEISRLGRPDTAEIGLISKIFRYTNTIIITPERIFDVSDEYERDMFEQELKRGNFYLEYTKKLLRKGREASVKSGNYVCSKPPYGYNKITIVENKRKCPTLEINEEQATIVRMIFDTYTNENVGTQVICNRLNDLNIAPPRGEIWTPDAIRTIIENPVYIGKIRWNERKAVLVVDNGEFRKTRPKTEGEMILAQGKHPAIISEEQFYDAQEKRKKAHRASVSTGIKSPFASILRCECGRAMSFRESGTADKPNPRLVCVNQRYCRNGSCSPYEIIDIVTDILKQRIAEFEVELQKGEDTSYKIHEKLIKNLEKKLSEIDAKELSLWESQVDPDMARRMPAHIFQSLTDKLVKEREETKDALDKARATLVSPVDYEKRLETFRNAVDSLNDDSVSVTEKNHLLKACIERIEYHREFPQTISGKPRGEHHVYAPIELNVKLKV